MHCNLWKNCWKLFHQASPDSQSQSHPRNILTWGGLGLGLLNFGGHSTLIMLVSLAQEVVCESPPSYCGWHGKFCIAHPLFWENEPQNDKIGHRKLGGVLRIETLVFAHFVPLKDSHIIGGGLGLRLGSLNNLGHSTLLLMLLSCPQWWLWPTAPDIFFMQW